MKKSEVKMNKIYCNLGVIGCGTFSDAYLSTLGIEYPQVRPVACCDLNEESARKAAEKWNIPTVCTSEEMFADPNIDIVLILTNPSSHYALTMQALKAGKNVYCEKPMATSLEEANEITRYAGEHGLFVGAAPDTFLSSEFQTVRKLLDSGKVGDVISFTANFTGPGSDLWHPNASFLYKKGGGPVLDMAPYFITNLVALLGPIESLFCYANRGFDRRVIRGSVVDVDVYTNYCGVMKFSSGVIGNINMSFDEWKTSQPGLELYGTKGVVFAPDPNTMMGPIRYLSADKMTAAVEGEPGMIDKLEMIYSPKTFALFEDVPPVAPRGGNKRGVGVADMADAILNGRKPRVSAELCRHVTEAINAFNQCAVTSLPYVMTTECERPAILLG